MTTDALQAYRLDQPLTEEETDFIRWFLSNKQVAALFQKAGVRFSSQPQNNIASQFKSFSILGLFSLIKRMFVRYSRFDVELKDYKLIYLILESDEERPEPVINGLVALGDNLKEQASRESWVLAIGVWGFSLRLGLAIWGEESEDTLTILNNLAGCWYSLGEARKALPLFQQAYERRQQVLGDDHPDTLQSLNNLAGCWRRLGEARKALPLQQQAYERCQQVFGDDHPDTLQSLNNLALCWYSLGEARKALLRLQQAYKHFQQVLGDDHPDTLTSLNNLAACWESLGEARKVLPLYQKAYERRQQVLGDDHPYTLQSLNNLAACWDRLGEARKALPLLQQTYERFQQMLGDDHPDTLQSLNNLAACLLSLGEARKALPLLQQNCKRLQQVLGHDHPDTLRIHWGYVLCLSKTAQTPSEQRRATDQCIEALQQHLRSPLRYQNWLNAIPSLATSLVTAIDTAQFPGWFPLLEKVSQELTETVDLQTDTLMGEAYQCSAKFHSTLIALCLRHNHTTHITTILSRIHGRQMATLVWEQLAALPPEQLGDDERELLKLRSEIARLRLGVDVIQGGLSSSFDGQREKIEDSATVAARQQTLVEERAKRIEELLPQYRELRERVFAKNPELRNALNAQFDFTKLKAALAPRQAIVVLVDSLDGQKSPFALLLRADASEWFVLPELPRLMELARFLNNAHTTANQRSGHRRSDIDLEEQTRGFSGDEIADEQNSGATYEEKIIIYFTLLCSIVKHIALLKGFCALSKALLNETLPQSKPFLDWQRCFEKLATDLKDWLQPRVDEISANDYDDFNQFKKRSDELAAQQPQLTYEIQADLMNRYFWKPFCEQCGNALDGIDHIQWITHGSLHTLPYDLGRPDPFTARLYHYPGLLAWGAMQNRMPSETDKQPAVIYADPGNQSAQNPIPFTLTDLEIARHFLPTPHTDLQGVLATVEGRGVYLESALSGHGARGIFYMHNRFLSWQELLRTPLSIVQVYISACLLGRVDEQYGEPLGWTIALMLKGSETVTAALAPISDFYSPLLGLLFYQTRFDAKDRQSAPEDALLEAKRRLLQGDWYQANDVESGNSTAELIKRYYPVGMHETVRLIRQIGIETNALIGGWHLPKSWQERLAAHQGENEVRDAIRNDNGESLIRDTLDYMLSDPKAIGQQPAVQHLALVMTCFGRSH